MQKRLCSYTRFKYYIQITIKLNLPEPGEYGIEIYASESKKKRSFAYACQYLVLYMADEEKSQFIEELCRGQSRDDSEAANASYLETEKEVTMQDYNAGCKKKK